MDLYYGDQGQAILMIIPVAKLFARLHEVAHERCNINIPGLGLLLRSIGRDLELSVRGKILFMNHKVADNYARLIGGRFNEPETHILLDRALEILGDKRAVVFVDVGANIGEFVLDYGARESIRELYAFEPQREQFIGIRHTVRLNGMSRVTAVNKAVGAVSGIMAFKQQTKNSSSSGLLNVGTGCDKALEVEVTTLDRELSKISDPAILLIDVEGAELLVMQGGEQFIRRCKPLVIFEYNHVTRAQVRLDQIQQFLGSEYVLMRLRRDGQLDTDMSRTWNIVAIHKNGLFSALLT